MLGDVVRNRSSICLAGAILALASSAVVAHSELFLPSSVGRFQRTGDMDVACTNAGLQARTHRQGSTYPVGLEFVGGYGQSLGNGIVTISHADGGNPITVACAAPRVLMRLFPGHYMATADMVDGPTKTVEFEVSKSDERKSLVIRFPGIMAGAPVKK
jgi:hypothetical protein